MEHKVLSLFQLCDSNFPTGAFSHSFGLESYIERQIVHDQATFWDWLHAYVYEQLVYADGLASRLVYEALAQGDEEKVWQLDRMLMVQNLPRETRTGTQKIGERMLSLVQTLYDIPIVSKYAERIKQKKSFGHPAIVFTMVGHHLKVSSFSTTLYYLYSTVMSLIQNAVRAIPLRQTIGQKMIQQFQQTLVDASEKIQLLDESDFGVVSPGLELAQMEHERVNVRIFMS